MDSNWTWLNVYDGVDSYRAIDGSENNLNYIAAGQQFLRVDDQSYYADELNEPLRQ